MENKYNKNSLKTEFSNEVYKTKSLTEIHNLLDKYDTIQFNGLIIPRLNFNNSIFMNSSIQPPNSLDKIFYKETKPIKKENDLYISLDEKDNQIFKEKQEKANLSKKDKIKKLIKTEKNQNIFNIFIKDDKNCNYIQPHNIFNANLNFGNKQNLIINHLGTTNLDSNIGNKINIINNNTINIINYPNCSFFQPIFYSDIQQKNYQKTIEKRKNFGQDFNLISSSNNSEQQNQSKNLFVVKVDPILNTEKNKEEINNDEQINYLTKKRGRKQTQINKKIHSATDDDNIIRKIQVHYISFIINFINDVIRVFIKSRNVPLFKNVDYKLKKIVNQKYFQKLKSLKIADILQFQPSPKMKNHDSNVNKCIYDKVCKICPFLLNFLQTNFISFFKEYYYFNNNKKNFIVDGIKIPISERTKTFHDLINKNYSYKEKIKFIALNYFLEDKKALEKFKFITE